MKKVISYVTTEQDAGKRLEWVLKQRLMLSSQEISQAKFRCEGICVDGLKCKVNREICAGERVDVCLEEEEKSSCQLIPMPGNLDILYEDEDVLAVCKPAGMVCHPVGGHYEDTLANVMQYYFQEKGQHVVIRLVGRLDQETSGIVLAAKSQAAASRLNRQQEQGSLRKEYLALTFGQLTPAAGKIEEPIGVLDEIRMQVCPDGKQAKTYYEVLETRQEISLVRLQLGTGRTHQIRVHMAYLGCPLVGDTLYPEVGRKNTGLDRAALHAFRLSFLQPFTGEKITLEAPIPMDLTEYLRKKGFSLVPGEGSAKAFDLNV